MSETAAATKPGTSFDCDCELGASPDESDALREHSRAEFKAMGVGFPTTPEAQSSLSRWSFRDTVRRQK